MVKTTSDLKDLKLGKYHIELQFTKNTKLTGYLGSTLRGALGHSLKRISCTQVDIECANCLLRHQCPYSYLFMAFPMDDLDNANVPVPYVIDPINVEKEIFEPGDTLSFGLLLFGKANQYWPYILVALQQWAILGIGKQRSPLILHRVYILHVDGTRKLIYQDGTIVDKPERYVNGLDIIDHHKQTIDNIKKNNHITIDFDTMTRLTDNGHLVNQPSFSVFVRSLLRRISALYLVHHNKQLFWDFSSFNKVAQEVAVAHDKTYWYDWVRYSSRQRTTMKLGGLKGSISFEGNLDMFAELLVLGSYTRVGKNTTFGLGRYSINEENKL